MHSIVDCNTGTVYRTPISDTCGIGLKMYSDYFLNHLTSKNVNSVIPLRHHVIKFRLGCHCLQPFNTTKDYLVGHKEACKRCFHSILNDLITTFGNKSSKHGSSGPAMWSNYSELLPSMVFIGPDNSKTLIISSKCIPMVEGNNSDWLHSTIPSLRHCPACYDKVPHKAEERTYQAECAGVARDVWQK